MDELRTCELCQQSDDICECSEAKKNEFYVEEIVKHEIQKIQTQNRYQILDQSEPERPKSVQDRIKNLFSGNKTKPEKDVRPKITKSVKKDAKREQNQKTERKPADRKSLENPRDAKRRDLKTTPPNTWIT